MIRIRVDLGYDGSGFSGWARQPGRRTVQQTLEDALARVLRLAETPQLTVAGRTDAGVHARGQVAHADLPADRWEAAAATLIRRLSGVLPPDLRVHAIGPARPGSMPASPPSGGATPTGSATIRPRPIRSGGTRRCGTCARSASMQ